MKHIVEHIAHAESIESGLVDAGFFDEATAVEILDAAAEHRIGLIDSRTHPVDAATQLALAERLASFFPDNDLGEIDVPVLIDILDDAQITLVADVDWADEAFQRYMQDIMSMADTDD